jgi:hypothetical protein
VVVLEAEKPQAMVQPEDLGEVLRQPVCQKYGLEIAVEMVVHHQFLKDMRVAFQLQLPLIVMTEAEAAEAAPTRLVLLLDLLDQLPAVPEEMVYQIQ